MLSEARQKKIMEKLNRAQKCSILGPQNLGSRRGSGPPGPPDPHLNAVFIFDAVCPVKYCEFSSDFVVNVAQMSLNWTELAHDWNIHDINNDINEEISSSRTALLTRMHSSRMRTALPPGNHTCPPATTHIPLATTHAPPRNHTPRQPCTPPVDRQTLVET